MDEIFEKRRTQLEENVQNAALALCEFMGSSGFMCTLKNTTPQLIFAFGEPESIYRHINSILQELREEITLPYGACSIEGPAEDVAFIMRHLPDVDDEEES